MNTADGTPYDAARFQGYRVNYDRRRAEEQLYQLRADLTLPLGSGGENTIKLAFNSPSDAAGSVGDAPGSSLGREDAT